MRASDLVLLVDEGLGSQRVGDVGLDQHEVVHHTPQLAQPQLQQVQLGAKHEGIEHLQANTEAVIVRQCSDDIWRKVPRHQVVHLAPPPLHVRGCMAVGTLRRGSGGVHCGPAEWMVTTLSCGVKRSCTYRAVARNHNQKPEGVDSGLHMLSKIHKVHSAVSIMM